MICDRVRTDGFRRAIESVVRPGDVVLDVGAGTGILSLFAARAGAARVYAVERTTVAVMAQELAAANGAADTVRVIHGDIMDIELPERVDVIVSEWLGGFGIDEGMLAPVVAARDRWLKPGGVMIPSSVTAWAGLVSRPISRRDRGVPAGRSLRPQARWPRRDDRQRDPLLRDLPSPRGRRQALRSRVGCGRRTRAGSRSRRRRRLTRPRRRCGSATPERPTRSRSGSAPSSRPASRSRSDRAIRRPTGG